MIRNVVPLSTLIVLCACAFAQAQDYENPDQYYRPITAHDLDYRLLPATDKYKKTDFGSSSLTAFNGGCPDTINIGGIGENTRVIGSVDINVNIDKDLIIDCNKR